MFNFNNYFARHMQAGLNSLGQLTRSPIASLMTCLVIGITLALPTALFVVLKNVEHVRGSFQQTSQLTLYLNKNVTDTQAQKLLRRLQNTPEITKAYAISPDKGLHELQQQAGFQGVLDNLTDNPLPWTVVVIPNTNASSSDELDTLTTTLKELPQVETVQSDVLWIKRFGTLIILAKRLVLTLSLFLGIAVLLIVNNSIRSATQNNQKEIEVIKLIGGTNAFIRRPFLYAGMLYGLLGGMIAWSLVAVLLLVLQSPTRHLAELYNSTFNLIGLGFTHSFALLFFSLTLGIIGSWLAVMRHLKMN